MAIFFISFLYIYHIYQTTAVAFFQLIGKFTILLRFFIFWNFGCVFDRKSHFFLTLLTQINIFIFIIFILVEIINICKDIDFIVEINKVVSYRQQKNFVVGIFVLEQIFICLIYFNKCSVRILTLLFLFVWVQEESKLLISFLYIIKI